MLKALIFDFDGLILDTETPEYLAWQNIYQEHGFELPHDEWGKIIGGYGLSDFDAAEHLALLSKGRLDSVLLRTRHSSESLARIHTQSVLPGVLDLIHAAKAHGLKLAIASRLSALNCFAISSRFSTPTPCSPVIEPPTSTQ